MKINFKNLGAIKSGEVNFDKNLVIITGPNNTGKSYLTYLFYGVCNFNKFIPEDDYARHVFKYLADSPDFISDIIKQNKPVLFKDLIEEYSSELGSLIGKTVKENFIEIFASSKIKPSLTVTVNSEINASRLGNTDIVGFQLIGNKFDVLMEDGEFGGKNPLDFSDKEDIYEEALGYGLAGLARLIKSNNLFGKAYIFPSERAAMNLFYRDIIGNKARSRDNLQSQLLKGNKSNKITKSFIKEQVLNPKYPLAVNDYLYFVNDAENLSYVSEYVHIADYIEQNLLGGSIAVSSDKQIEFRPHGSKQVLNLYESSCLVKSLSYFVLYLRHFAIRGEWVIIDEPELNLHPNLQVLIARAISEMTNSGLKVLISTHSDYLVKELNTLLMLRELYEDKKNHAFIKRRGYTPAQLLDRSKVGAYYLNKGTVKSLDVEADGITVDSIDQTIADIDTTSEEVYFKLNSSKK